MPDRTTQSLRLPLPGGVVLAGTLSHTGPPGPAALLFIHGFGSTHAGHKAAALEAVCARRGWTFAAVSLRGHGPSSGILRDVRADSLQEDLEGISAFLSTTGIERLFLVGSSMGGWAGAWFARRHRDRVPAVAAIAPGLNFPRGRWLRLPEADRLRWQQTGRLQVFNEGRGRDDELSFDLVGDFDCYHLEALAEGWATPTLIYHGVQDDVVPWRDSLTFLERVGPAAPVELHLFSPGDHRLFEQRFTMAEGIAEFFGRYWG
jgi:pimeloyl-ACP methyl ester carboxylesterase